MKATEILERIIEEKGECTWATPITCRSCPLGRLARNNADGGLTGEWMSCVDALDIDGLSKEEADARYLKAAKEKLADITINSIIEED